MRILIAAITFLSLVPAALAADPPPENPAEAARRLEDARAHLDAERWTDAIKTLSPATKLDPKNGEIPLLLARAYLARSPEQGDPKRREQDQRRGVSLVRRAAKLAPGDGATQFLLGDVTLPTHPITAASAYRRAIKAGHRATEARDRLAAALVDSAFHLKRAGRTDVVARELTQAIGLARAAIDAGRPLTTVERRALIAFVALPGLPRSARARHAPRLATLVAATPDDGPLRLALGRALAATSRPDDALPHLKRAVELEANGARAELAAHSLDAGRLDEARAALEAILRDDPTDAHAHLLLADVHLRDGELEPAARSLRTVAKDERRQVRGLRAVAMRKLAAVLVRMGEFDEADFWERGGRAKRPPK